MASEYAKSVGNALRNVRQQQRLSLQAVEEKSDGRWKAVVVGSYERGDRACSVEKLSDLASFYGVPVSELLPERSPASASELPARLVLDLERICVMPVDKAGQLSRYVAAIQAQRGDYNGRVLTVRGEDLRTLAVIYDISPSELIADLTGWGILRTTTTGS